ncbi:RluA family pseudouridine synthase [Rurimicrobium arvi]|uniref:Pseudouridine synthase n=1 Tax=Rurimicrobium arvi TaxID=2049916 RepID=A0ABP8MKI6_9BACT
MKLEILYEDAHLIAVNKPAGIPVIPDRFNTDAPSVNKLLEAATGSRIWVIHRLDRDTSGVLLFAKDELAHKKLSLQFQEHSVGKFYAGLVNGRLAKESGRIESPIAEHPTIKGKMIVTKSGKPSVTDYRVVSQWPLHSLLQFQIHTGRTHQIRVHMQSIGHPIVADNLYGDGEPFRLSAIKKKYKLSLKEEEERPLLSRLALHAYRLIFEDMEGRERMIEAPLPKDINACVQQLNKQQSKHTF